MKWRQSFCLSRNSLALLLVIIAGATLLGTDSPIPRRSQHLPGPSAASATAATVALNGANRWDGDKEATVPSFGFSSPGARTITVSPLFTAYYHRHSGATSLGDPLTVAFHADQGWMQFFEWGALLLPTAQQGSPHDEDPLVELIDSGTRDARTGILRIPLLQALLTAGSQEPIGGAGSPLTYVDLRQATNPDLLLPTPAAGRTAALSTALRQSIFIQGGTRDGKAVGHLIPRPIWNAITRPDISPDGWEADFGAPLTEALSFAITKQGLVHRMLVQAFWKDGLVLDQTTLDAWGQPQVERLESGLAYLRTLGPPPVVMSAQQILWAQGDSGLEDWPETGHVVAHIGLHFPLTLLGGTTWSAGMLWYHVGWAAPKRAGAGWVQASAITFTSPGTLPAWASFDVLSPDLAAYLADIGENVDAVVYDVTRQRYYSYHANAQFIMGSSMKVPIMLTFLDMTEREGRQPDAHELDLLTTMIENSNNDSASALYYGEIGGAAGVAGYLRKIGIAGLDPDPTAWGYSLVTPLAMVNLLTDLSEGTILTAHDRDLALSLMVHIESDQQVGVGDTAPRGASVAMKDGWLPGPDGLWAMNSSGIVTVGRETYFISVYTQEQRALGDGQAIARHVCSSVASLLA